MPVRTKAADAKLELVADEAAGCRACDLWRNATQTVFGDGPAADARLVLVGEQPGDEEDRAGEPFVGPAGRELDRALEEAEIERSDAYVTNVVKHFKWEAKGKRRLHRKPNAREVAACLPWLMKEIELLRPRVLVCLGATASQALFGSGFRVSQQRGVELESALAPHAIATVHPSSILRQPGRAERDRERRRFVHDLGIVARWLAAG
jgi:uracil-DNA glycosylase family protein